MNRRDTTTATTAMLGRLVGLCCALGAAATVAACNGQIDDGPITTPDATTPDATTPDGTSPDGTNPPDVDPDTSNPPDGADTTNPPDIPPDVPAGPCPDNVEVFQNVAWDPVLSDKCILCHTSDGAAALSAMVFEREGDSPQWLQNNMAVFNAVVKMSEGGESIVLLKPTNTHSMGHGGLQVIEEGSEQYEALDFYTDWVRGDLPACNPNAFGGCVDDLPGPRLLRRLTHSAYDHTIKDLLGLDSTYGETFAADNVVGVFSNNANALGVDKLLADQYRVAAEALAEQAVNFQLNALLPCDPETDGLAMCAAQFIDSFGTRAFRRPVSQAELDTYWALWDDVAREDGFATGIQWVITAMLQSPQFLYRQELGTGSGSGDFALTDWEIASQLSYLLWDTMPDDTAFQKAAAGELHTTAQIEAEVTRLLGDAKSQNAVASFVAQWLGINRLKSVPKTMQDFPALTFAVRDLMAGETTRLVANLMAEGGTLEDLLQADHSYMTDALAQYYGIPAGSATPDAQGYRKVPLAGTNYGGLLTQGSVLTVNAHPDTTSPVRRGVFVRERMLCQELPPPPEGVDASPPPKDPTKTLREQMEAHLVDPGCADCHDRIDPIGLAFEHFDGAGVWRDMHGDGLAIDAMGEIIKGGSANGTFDGVDELQSVLAGAHEVQDCYIDMWVTYATGLHEVPELGCAAGLIAESTAGASIALSEPLTALTALTHFRNRVGDVSEGDGDASNPGTLDLSFYATVDDAVYPDGDGGGNPGGGDLIFTLTTNNSWADGYCMDGAVENPTAEDVTWQVSAEVVGEINNIWNANANKVGTLTYFTGASYNAVVAPGATVTFGFCANY